MAEIDTLPALIANSANTDPRMWEAIGNIPKAYYEGQDQAYKQKMRDASSDSNGGLPLDAQGNFDAGKAWERLVKLGGAPGVDAAAKLAETGFQQDRYRNAPSVESVLRGDLPQPPTLIVMGGCQQGFLGRVARLAYVGSTN